MMKAIEVVVMVTTMIVKMVFIIIIKGNNPMLTGVPRTILAEHRT